MSECSNDSSLVIKDDDSDHKYVVTRERERESEYRGEVLQCQWGWGVMFCRPQIVQVNCVLMRLLEACSIGRPGSRAGVSQKWVYVSHMTDRLVRGKL